VDQLEELFTHVDDERTRAALLTCLATAAEDPASRVRVVVTLRADFYDRPLAHGMFGPLLAAQSETITPLSAAELGSAISGPTHRARGTLEPALMSELVADATDRPGSLPLLQYALTELFDRGHGALSIDDYREIGGVGGALANRAENLYATRGHEAGRE